MASSGLGPALGWCGIASRIVIASVEGDACRGFKRDRPTLTIYACWLTRTLQGRRGSACCAACRAALGATYRWGGAARRRLVMDQPSLTVGNWRVMRRLLQACV